MACIPSIQTPPGACEFTDGTETAFESHKVMTLEGSKIVQSHNYIQTPNFPLIKRLASSPGPSQLVGTTLSCTGSLPNTCMD